MPHSAAISSRGELYTWGRNCYGCLGHESSDDKLQPLVVEALKGQRVVDVACGSGDAQTLAVTDSGLLYSWGDVDYGKLGKVATFLRFIFVCTIGRADVTIPIQAEAEVNLRKWSTSCWTCS